MANETFTFEEGAPSEGFSFEDAAPIDPEAIKRGIELGVGETKRLASMIGSPLLSSMSAEGRSFSQKEREEAKILAENQAPQIIPPREVIGPMPGREATEPFKMGDYTITPSQEGPGIPYIRPPKEAGTVEKVAAGAFNTLAGIPNFMLSLPGVATLAAPAALPARFLNPALRLGFGAVMAKTTIQAANKAWETKDPQDIAEAIGAGAFTLLIAKGRNDPEFQKEVLRQQRLKQPSVLPSTERIANAPQERPQPVSGVGEYIGVAPRSDVSPDATQIREEARRQAGGGDRPSGVAPPAPGGAQEGPPRVLLAESDAVKTFRDQMADRAIPVRNNQTAQAGMGLKSVADLDSMLQMLKDERAASAASLAEAQRTGDFSKLVIGRDQYPREVIETATKTGSWETDFPELGVKGDRPLQWDKNPEVENWVKQHGKEVWTNPEAYETLPDKLKAEPAKPAEAAPVAPTPVAPTPPVEAQADKEPWQMTKSEIVARDKQLWGEQSTEAGQRAMLTAHRAHVRDAIREGKSVPPEVLADYPDLNPAAPTPPPAAPAAAPPPPPSTPGAGPGTPEAPGQRLHAFGPVGHVVTWLENLFRSDRAGQEAAPNAPPPSRRRLVADLTDRLLGGDAAERVDAMSRQVAGESVPRTMAAAPESGNAMVRFASASVAAPHVARSMTREILGDRWKDQTFRDKLGAVLVEDRLRAIRKGLQDAAMRETDPEKVAALIDQVGQVNRLTGEGKPFADETEFQAALNDPEIKAAIERHKATVQAQAEKFHVETGGQMAGAGLHTGAFVNLQPIFEDAPQMVFSGATKGDYTRPFKRKSVFSRQAKGTAEKYELDYGTLAERMIRGNFEEYTKRQLYDQLVKDGLAVVEGPGVPRPTFEGKPAVKFQIVRRGGAPGQTVIQNLWVRPDIAPELRAAENLDGPIRGAAATRMFNVINAIQLAGPTDATWHVANMMSSISSAQGGKSLLVDLARKVPIANVIDSTVRVTLAARKVLQRDPDVLRQLSELSQIGAVRPERAGGGLNSRIINLLDKAGRFVRDDMYQNLVQRGLIKASEEGRREWVNQMGQYNPRLMGQFQAFFKEAGLSPFIVAGRNFNRQAMRRVTLSPGVRAANVQSAVQMRAVEAFGVMATLLAVPAVLNSVTTGKPGGRAGVPFGGIDTGKDDKNGKPIYIDPAQWIGLRRGLRMTGMNAIVEGLRKGETTRRISQRAGQDIIGAAVHPWAGPAVQAPVITATGKTTSGYKESKDPGNYWENVKAAMININPLLHGWMQKQARGVTAGVEAMGRSLSGAVGVKAGPKVSASQELRQLAVAWMDKSSDPKIQHKLEVGQKQDFGESDYKPLRQGLDQGDLDASLDAYHKLLSEGKKPMDVLRAIRPFTVTEVGGEYFRHEKPIAGLSQREQQQFLKSLSPEDRKTFERSKTERMEQFRKFQDLLKKDKAQPKVLEPVS